MSNAKIKIEIKELVEAQSDMTVLKAVRKMLSEATLEKKLIERANESEADIANGRVYSIAEVKKRLNK